MSTIAIQVFSAPLPEGWEGTPDEFRQQIFSTLTFQGSGEFLTGQVGGGMPQSDVGIYISGQDIYVWSAAENKYVPIHTHPIGSVLPYLGTVAPTNYLLLDGSLKPKADYKELYALIGDAHRRSNDGTSDDFRLPNMRGRTFFGAGVGDYSPLDEVVGTPPQMREIVLHEYDGLEWPRKLVAKHVGQPAAAASPGDSLIYTGAVGTAANSGKYTRSMPPHLGINWMVRAL